MSNYTLVNLGKRQISELDFNSPIIYKSESLISSMSYSGTAIKINDSNAFTEEFKSKLTKIKGFVSLGTTGGEFRNAHIYSNNAICLDGRERICYIQQDKDNNQLIVSEYSGNRGAKYSALYLILRQELSNSGFVGSDSNFIIDSDRLLEFVEIVNKVIDNRKQGKYELIAINQTESIVIDKNKYYYFKAYWQVKEEVSHEEGFDIAIRMLASNVNECGDKEILLDLRNKLDVLMSVVRSKIDNIEAIEKLTT